MLSVKTFFDQTKVSSYSINPLNLLLQLRGAKKRAVGSRTNNKDSAGRRLGPKKHEGHFVKPGQIIMRQRGTKIHPGDNVKIGKDHTIYAVEPGFVRFYYDPFHPLRKYVGVALTNDIKLPKPHFEPRLRRFGFVKVSKSVEAKEVEDHMSRKEEIAQPKLSQSKEVESSQKSHFIGKFKDEMTNKFQIKYDEESIVQASQRLYDIHKLLKVGLSLPEAKLQCTYEKLYTMKLNYKNGKYLNENEYHKLKENYINFVQKVDSDISVDFKGKLHKLTSIEEHKNIKSEIKKQLESLYSNDILKPGYKDQVKKLINSPGVFNAVEQNDLTNLYLPRIIPYNIKGSLIDAKSIKNNTKDKIHQIYDEKSRTANHYIIKALS